MPTFLAKLLMLLAIAAVAVWQIGGFAPRRQRRRPALDSGSAAIGVLFAVSIANNAMGYLSDAYVLWLCGGRTTPPTALELTGMQAQVWFVAVAMAATMFRELRLHLDRPGAPRQRLAAAALRALVALALSGLLCSLGSLPGRLATAVDVAASSLRMLAIETLVVTAALALRGRPGPVQAD